MFHFEMLFYLYYISCYLCNDISIIMVKHVSMLAALVDHSDKDIMWVVILSQAVTIIVNITYQWVFFGAIHHYTYQTNK